MTGKILRSIFIIKPTHFYKHRTLTVYNKSMATHSTTMSDLTKELQARFAGPGGVPHVPTKCMSCVQNQGGAAESRDGAQLTPPRTPGVHQTFDFD